MTALLPPSPRELVLDEILHVCLQTEISMISRFEVDRALGVRAIVKHLEKELLAERAKRIVP